MLEPTLPSLYTSQVNATSFSFIMPFLPLKVLSMKFDREMGQFGTTLSQDDLNPID